MLVTKFQAKYLPAIPYTPTSLKCIFILSYVCYHVWRTIQPLGRNTANQDFFMLAKSCILTVKPINGIFFFFFFLIWVLRPFQKYFTYMELILHQRWAKPENSGENHQTICKQNCFPTCDPSKARITAVRNLMYYESGLLSTRLMGPAIAGIIHNIKQGNPGIYHNLKSSLWKCCVQEIIQACPRNTS